MGQRKHTRALRLIAGILLITLAVLGLLGGICFILVGTGSATPPPYEIWQGCLTYHGGRPTELEEQGWSTPTSQARMILSVSVPGSFDQGLGTRHLPTYWVVHSDTWSFGSIKVVRQGEVVAVNGRLLSEGQTIRRPGVASYWKGLGIPPSFSLWIVTWRRAEITNYGVFGCYMDKTGRERASDGLYVHIGESRGWAPNPLGPALLGVGIWLLIRARRAQAHEGDTED